MISVAHKHLTGECSPHDILLSVSYSQVYHLLQQELHGEGSEYTMHHTPLQALPMLMKGELDQETHHRQARFDAIPLLYKPCQTDHQYWKAR